MTRKDFFKSLAGLVALPFALNAKPENEVTINDITTWATELPEPYQTNPISFDEAMMRIGEQIGRDQTDFMFNDIVNHPEIYFNKKSKFGKVVKFNKDNTVDVLI